MDKEKKESARQITESFVTPFSELCGLEAPQSWLLRLPAAK